MSSKYILFFAILFLFSCVGKHQTTKQKNKTEGIWRKSCGTEAGFIKFDGSSDTAFIELNSNQIHITAKAEEVQKDIFQLKLIEPVELGSGGIRLNWKNFSRDSTIINMEIVSDTVATIQWLGFYDGKKRVWKYDSELLSHTANENKRNTQTVRRCK